MNTLGCTSHRTFLASTAGLLLVLLIGPSGVDAQDVRFKTVETSEYAGFMGSVMRLSGESTGPDTTTTWIRNALRREDQANGKASWVIDLASMDMMRIDHEERVYWTLNFPAYMASADSAASAAREDLPEDQPVPAGSFEPTIEVDRTGETRTINGWDAERVIVTLTLTPAENRETPPDGQPMSDAESDPMAAMMGRMSMVMLSDLWISDEMPGYREMRESLGKDAPDFAEGSGGMEALAAGYPQMAALTEEFQEQMQGIEGDAVRSTVYMLMVPTGVEFERDSVLAMSDQPLPQGPDLSDLMAEMMAAQGRDAAADAVGRALGGRLGGLLGRDRSEPDEEDVEVTGAASGPTVMMREISEIIEVERPTLTDADFQPPEGYREVQRGG